MDNGNMNLIFRGQGKQLCISIDGYEFDDEYVKQNKDEFGKLDDEWLMIKAVYTDVDEELVCYDPSLEVYELNYLSEQISKVLKNTEQLILVEFIEPNLMFKFNQNDKGYSVWVQFGDERRQRRYAVTQEMSFSELEAFRSEVDAAYNKYSNRFDKLL